VTYRPIVNAEFVKSDIKFMTSSWNGTVEPTQQLSALVVGLMAYRSEQLLRWMVLEEPARCRRLDTIRDRFRRPLTLVQMAILLYCRYVPSAYIIVN